MLLLPVITSYHHTPSGDENQNPISLNPQDSAVFLGCNLSNLIRPNPTAPPPANNPPPPAPGIYTTPSTLSVNPIYHVPSCQPTLLTPYSDIINPPHQPTPPAPGISRHTLSASATHSIDVPCQPHHHFPASTYPINSPILLTPPPFY